MQQKHLFRCAVESIPGAGSNTAEEVVSIAYLKALEEELKRADETLAKYFPLHVIPVGFDEINQNTYSEYTRDAMQQIGDAIYIKSNADLSNRSKLEKGLRQAGYNGSLIPDNWWSEGGRFIVGNKFCLVSDFHEGWAVSRVSEMAKMPAFPVHSFTSTWHEHIDCDYSIVDEAEILYATAKPHDILFGRRKGFIGTRETLDAVASETGYNVRRYRNGKYRNGINFITDNGIIFTTGMHQKEMSYLQRRDIRVVVIPLTCINGGAGLRCAYGEAVF